MKHIKEIIGEKVYLSKLNIEDAEKYVEWFCDFGMTDGIGKSDSIVTLLFEKRWIDKTLKNDELNLAIRDLKNDKLIGNCGFSEVNYKDKIANVGIYIGEEKNRNNGYGTEALRLLVSYGFNRLNFNNIMLTVKSFNKRAIACYKKVGFKEIGTRRECYFLNGKYYDDIYMDILAREFKENLQESKNK